MNVKQQHHYISKNLGLLREALYIKLVLRYWLKDVLINYNIYFSKLFPKPRPAWGNIFPTSHYTTIDDDALLRGKALMSIIAI